MLIWAAERPERDALVPRGRGHVIDQGALADALYAGGIRAALDVSNPEPLPADDRLWQAPRPLENVVRAA